MTHALSELNRQTIHMHANPQQMHVHFRRVILQPLLTQHAKATLCVPQVMAKHANMQKTISKKHALLRQMQR